MSSPGTNVLGGARRGGRPRQELLESSTIREFGGGLNVIDNDLNLSTRFSRVLSNMVRAKDGATTLRPGMELFADLENQVATTGTLGVDPLTTTAASQVVTVVHTAHGLISGHSTTLAGLAALDGIPAIEFNTTHVVTVVSANSYTIVVTTPAGAGATGGGSSGTFSHNNKNIGGDVVDAVYAQDRIVGVDDAGTVFELDGTGAARVVFNAAIAGKLVGAPSGWSATVFVSFATFGGQLIICNGVDKPLLADFDSVAPTAPVQYLQDVATGSNLNTPICRYVIAMDHYLLMVGDPAFPGKVHISNFDTSGTWQGDPAPNDGTQVDLDKVITTSADTIRGINRFREHVIVAFDDTIVIGSLGIYDDTGAHTPDFDETIEQFGSIAHRSMVNVGDDLLFADTFGVSSLRQALFTGSIQPQRVSEFVDPNIQAAMNGLSIGTTEDRVFAIYNRLEGQYMLFVPNADTIGATTETQGFVYTKVDTLKIKAWAEVFDWNWSCALVSALGRVFFGKNKKFFLMGDENHENFADNLYDYDDFAWANATAYAVGDRVRESALVGYECLVGHTSAASGSWADDRTANPTYWELYIGDDINFDWQLPWADFDKRMHTKHSRYLGLDTQGEGDFTAQMFLNNIYESKETPGLLLPALSISFVGGDAPGFGGGTQPFGGGRRTSNEFLWDWPAKFKIAKLRFFGAAKKKLKFVSISLLYLKGSIRP